eukprot:768749-Hanusia_phi.AAC.4
MCTDLLEREKKNNDHVNLRLAYAKPCSHDSVLAPLGATCQSFLEAVTSIPSTIFTLLNHEIVARKNVNDPKILRKMTGDSARALMTPTDLKNRQAHKIAGADEDENLPDVPPQHRVATAGPSDSPGMTHDLAQPPAPAMRHDTDPSSSPHLAPRKGLVSLAALRNCSACVLRVNRPNHVRRRFSCSTWSERENKSKKISFTHRIFNMQNIVERYRAE